MLPSDFLDTLAEPIIALWSKVESDIIADIVRRLLQADYLTPSAKWQVVKARELGLTQQELIKRVAKASGMSTRSVQRAVEEASAESLQVSVTQYRKVGMSTTPLEGSKAMRRVIDMGTRQTSGLMKNFTRTLADTALKAFENSLDEAWLQVTSGAFSIGQALRTIVRELSRKGVTSIAYPRGHVDQLDVAARRAVITGVNHTVGEVQLQAAEDMGTDLVQVSSHPGARPSHAVWQGGIFSISGKSTKYKPFRQTTGYGTGAGLCGWNCKHSFYIFVEGVSEPSFDRDPSQTQYGRSNDELYAQSQRQRELERRVRESKRECTALDAARKAAKDPAELAAYDAEFANAAKLLKQREARLDAYCKDTDRKKLVDRVQVEGYNKSVSGKVTATERKRVERSNYLSDVKPTQPKTAKVPDTVLSSTVDVTTSLVNGIVPKGTELTNVRVFAGHGVSAELRTASKMVNQYGGDDWKWDKRGAICTSDNFVYDVHWYEYEGKQYDARVKGVKAK